MFPTLELGPLELNTYSVIYLLAITIAGMLAFHRLFGQIDRPVGVITRGLLVTLVAGFAGAFAAAFLVDLAQHLIAPNVEASWRGSSVLGALAGGSLAAAIYVHKQGYPLGQPFDLAGLALPLGQAIGRLGCYARGCCFGEPTHGWPGMYLLNSRGEWAVRYPTQLMSAGLDLAIFVGLLLVERYCLRRWARMQSQGPASEANAGSRQRIWPFDGFIFLLYVTLYSVKRFFMEFLRGDALPPLVGPLNLVQLLCLAGMTASIGLIIWNTKRREAFYESGDYAS